MVWSYWNCKYKNGCKISPNKRCIRDSCTSEKEIESRKEVSGVVLTEIINIKKHC